jgi:NAD dependent epimerase/dehydratase family enzyme
MLKPIKFGLGAAFGTGKQIQSWIHLTDLTEMYLFAAQNQLEGIYNAVAPNPISNKQLTVAIAKKLKKPLFLPNIPEFMMQLILGEMHEILFSSQNVNNNKIINEGFSFKYTSVEKALEHLV